jgi:hypothetical protein
MDVKGQIESIRALVEDIWTNADRESSDFIEERAHETMEDIDHLAKTIESKLEELRIARGYYEEHEYLFDDRLYEGRGEGLELVIEVLEK